MDALFTFLELQDLLYKTAAKELKSKQQREIELWRIWKENGKKPEHLRPLLQSLKPFIESQANQWATRNRDIPPSAVRAEFMNHAVRALETYDPNKAALNTHLGNQLKKARRFVVTHMNPARIPESRVYKVRQLQDAITYLDEQLGRPPTQLELADHLKWSPREIETLQKEIRKSYPTGHFVSDPSSVGLSRHQEILRLLPYELTPEERAVFEYTYGVGGKPQLSPGEIARTLKMHPSKVSRLKKAVADKYSKYIK